MSNSPKALRQQQPERLSEQERDHQALLLHLRQLVESDPQEARAALEMSQEHAPEMFQIAQDQPEMYWADALMSSDLMHSLMSRSPSQAKVLTEQPDLRSVLELML